MEEGIAWILVIIALLILFGFTARYVIWGVFWFLASLGFLVFSALDGLFSAALLPATPWLMWVVWGAVIGGAAGFWSVAPVYGLRRHRPWILAAPFGLMLLVLGVRVVLQGA